MRRTLKTKQNERKISVMLKLISTAIESSLLVLFLGDLFSGQILTDRFKFQLKNTYFKLHNTLVYRLKSG